MPYKITMKPRDQKAALVVGAKKVRKYKDKETAEQHFNIMKCALFHKVVFFDPNGRILDHN